MLQPSDYLRIGKRGETCAACGKALTEEPRHASVLVEDQGAGPDLEEAAEVSEESPEVAGEAPSSEEETGGEESSGESGDAADGEDATAEDKKAEEEGYRRIDYCPECWQEIKDRVYFSFWLGKPRDDDMPRRKLSKVERNLALAALFDSLNDRQGEGEDDFTPHLFFLAHLLMKYKIFKWKPGVEDSDTGGRVLLFDRTDCDEEVRIPDMRMPSEMVVKVKEEVEAYLKESTGQVVGL